MKTQFKNSVANIYKIRKNPIVTLHIPTIKDTINIDINSLIPEKQFKEIDVILNTNGGDINAAYRIIKQLREIGKKVNIIIPLIAKSAGTLISLSGDSIIMTEISELGPLDPQKMEYHEDQPPTLESSLDGLKSLAMIQNCGISSTGQLTEFVLAQTGLQLNEAVKVASSFGAEVAIGLSEQLNIRTIGKFSRWLKLSEMYAETVLTRYLNWSPEKASKTAKKLVNDYPDHGYIIDIEEAQKLGLNVEKATNKKLLHNLREIQSALREMTDLALIGIYEEKNENKKTKTKKSNKQTTLQNKSRRNK
jgi:hypothetical protein